MKSNIGDFGQTYSVYTIPFLSPVYPIHLYSDIMPRKKKSSPNPPKSKSLKDLELENEVIYNKKHVWMRRLFLEFLKDRFPKTRKPRSLYPATANSFCLCVHFMFSI